MVVALSSAVPLRLFSSGISVAEGVPLARPGGSQNGSTENALVTNPNSHCKATSVMPLLGANHDDQ